MMPTTEIKHKWPLFFQVLVLTILCLGILPVWGADLRPTILTGEDLLSFPHQAVMLRAHLKSGSLYALQRSVPKASISFYLGDDLQGTGQTDSLGTATLRRFAPEKGDLLIRLVYSGNEALAEAESSLRLFVRSPDSRFIVTGIDEVLARTTPRPVYLDGSERTVRRALLTLRRLESKLGYTPIYMTSRENSLKNLTQDWLETQGFPSGPIFTWDSFDAPLSPRQYKLAKINQLLQQWEQIQWAVVSTLEEAELYHEAGIRAILITSQESDSLPPDIFWVPDWRSVYRLIESES